MEIDGRIMNSGNINLIRKHLKEVREGILNQLDEENKKTKIKISERCKDFIKLALEYNICFNKQDNCQNIIDSFNKSMNEYAEDKLSSMNLCSELDSDSESDSDKFHKIPITFNEILSCMSVTLLESFFNNCYFDKNIWLEFVCVVADIEPDCVWVENNNGSFKFDIFEDKLYESSISLILSCNDIDFVNEYFRTYIEELYTIKGFYGMMNHFEISIDNISRFLYNFLLNREYDNIMSVMNIMSSHPKNDFHEIERH